MMYSLAIHLYALVVACIAPFHRKARLMRAGQARTLDLLRERIDRKAKYIWFHAASLGEFEQGRPLMERIRAEHPEYKILLTFFSPSGYEVRKNYAGADVICYLPFDTPDRVHDFLDAAAPVMAFFIKYEFWYNYLHILKHRSVPTYSVSSIFRKEQIFFKWYARHYANVLRCFTHFYVQNEESRQLLSNLGITEVTITGDTRFDRVLQIKEQSKQLPIVASFVGQTDKVFVAGSSWEPDEDIFITYFNKHPQWKMVIAPHVISESHLQQIIEKVDGKVVRYTQTTEEEAAQARVLIIDCFGLLSSIYHYGQVSYVGGGFGVGIHNVLEAAVWHIPVIFGPNNQRFAEARGLITAERGFEIRSFEDFASLMDKFDADSEALERAGLQAGTFVASKSGATHKILNDVGL